MAGNNFFEKAKSIVGNAGNAVVQSAQPKSIGKSIEEKQSKKGEPCLMFSAFSAEKVQDCFEYIWVRFVRFGKEQEEWLVPGCKVTAKGEVELSVYNDRLSFSCKVDELNEYVPQLYNPQN